MTPVRLLAQVRSRGGANVAFDGRDLVVFGLHRLGPEVLGAWEALAIEGAGAADRLCPACGRVGEVESTAASDGAQLCGTCHVARAAGGQP
jgi:hypothetical protein